MFLHLFARLHMECILQACAFHRHCELWSLLVPSFFTLRFGVTSTPKDTWQGFPSWSHELLQAMQEKTTTLETFDAVLGLHLAISTISRPFLCTSGDRQIASQTGTTLQRRIRSQFGIGYRVITFFFSHGILLVSFNQPPQMSQFSTSEITMHRPS